MVKSGQGAIAQLGERVNGIHEGGSAILPGSTNFISKFFAGVKSEGAWLARDASRFG